MPTKQARDRGFFICGHCERKYHYCSRKRHHNEKHARLLPYWKPVGDNSNQPEITDLFTARGEEELPMQASTSIEAEQLSSPAPVSFSDQQLPTDTSSQPPPDQCTDTTPSISTPIGENSGLLVEALKELAELKTSINTLTKECESLRREMPIADQNKTPKHQDQPNNLTKDPSSALINEIRSARCVSELLNLQSIQTNFSVFELKLKCLTCHVKETFSEDGISLPPTDEACFVQGKDVQSKAFLNMKQRVIDHLTKSKTHQKNIRDLSEEMIHEKRLRSKNSIAGMTVGTLIYSMVQQKDSYSSYEQRILMCSLIPGTYVGDVNHSRKFVPQYIRTMHSVLKESFLQYMHYWDQKLGFPLPISITADKDSNRHRSRQITGVRFPLLGNDPSLPLFKTLYLGHPACHAFTGEALSEEIFDLLKKFDFTVKEQEKRNVGGVFDGQYLNLNVIEHLARKMGVDAKSLMNVWDGAHLIELAIGDVFNGSSRSDFQGEPLVSNAIKTLGKIACFMSCGKAYECLIDAAQGEKFKQPCKLKDMKFISHSLSAVTNFVTEYERILEALQSLTKDEKKADEATGYITKLSQPEFMLTMCFLKDILTLLSHFSKLFQVDDSNVADYYNNTRKLIACLKSLEITKDPTTETRRAMPAYYERLHDDCALIVPPTKTLRSFYTTQNADRDPQQTMIRKHNKVIEDLAVSIERRFSVEYVPQADILKDIALMLNDLTEDFIDEDWRLLFCGHCGVLKSQKSIRKHHRLAHEGKSLRTIEHSLKNRDVLEKSVNFDRIAELIQPHASVEGEELRQQLNDQYPQMKKQFKAVQKELKDSNTEISLNSCVKLFYSEKKLYENVPKLIRMAVLRLITIHVSEAICESFGSVMEQYNHRMTNTDMDDDQLQTEMFLNLSLPPISKAKDFIRKCVNKHNTKFVLQESARFSGKGAVLSRLSSKQSVFPFI